MSVNWEDSTSPARLKAVEAANASGEFDSTVPTWDIYCDLREALIWALLITGFPPKSGWGLNEDNWKAIYCRLQILERVNGCSRRYNNGAGNPTRDMYFTALEVESMVGLSVNAGNKTDAEFKKDIWKQLLEGATGRLTPSSRVEEDPYYWEKIFAPKEIRDAA
jgi:hypothetical protein